MRVSALASGSSGNCFFVEKDGKGILVDAGISCSRIAKNLMNFNFNPEKIEGIFVTHEHSDHIKGAELFSRKFNVPIFATKRTLENINPENVNIIKNDETVKLAGLMVEAFSKSHKALDPISFNIYDNKKLSIITDLGYASNPVLDSVSTADFLCLESNYDELMLEYGRYPAFLKKWISSDVGHLSNKQAALCFLEHGTRKTKNILLSHISQNNNTYQKAFDNFKSLIKERIDLKPKVMISERGKASELFNI